MYSLRASCTLKRTWIQFHSQNDWLWLNIRHFFHKCGHKSRNIDFWPNISLTKMSARLILNFYFYVVWSNVTHGFDNSILRWNFGQFTWNLGLNFTNYYFSCFRIVVNKKNICPFIIFSGYTPRGKKLGCSRKTMYIINIHWFYIIFY